MRSAALTSEDQSLLHQLLAFVPQTGTGNTTWYYRQNPDGTMRWVWPQQSRHPLFLALWHRITLKAKVQGLGIRSAFALGQSVRIADGSFTLPLGPDAFRQWHQQLGTDTEAVFTGTTGPNRKLVLAFANGSAAKAFVKLPVGTNAPALIRHEAELLQELGKLDLSLTRIPAVLPLGGARVALEALPTDGQTQHLTPLHWQAFEEWKNLTAKTTTLNRSQFWGRLQEQFRRLIVLGAHQRFGKVYELMRMLADRLDGTMPILEGLGHGDFTPWNSAPSQGRLSVWDWELASTEVPVGLDAVHFLVQGQAMLQGKNYQDIKDKLAGINPQLGQLLQGYPAQLRAMTALYLLDITSRYLETYYRQGRLHTQAEHILTVWEEALQEQVVLHNRSSHRSLWLEDLLGILKEQNEYVWLKPQAGHPAYVSESSDIDLGVSAIGMEKILAFAAVSTRVIRKQAFRFTDRTALLLHFADGSRLNLDLLSAFRYKGTVYLAMDEVLAEAVKTEDSIYIASPVHDWAYTSAFYSLNGVEIPQKHQTRLQALISQNFPTFQQFGFYHLNHSFQTQEELLDTTALKAVWKSYLTWKNGGMQGIGAKLRYASDLARQVARPRGAVVTLSGVDGAGKSTVLDALEAQLNAWRYPVVRLRHRPSMIPILSAMRYGKTEAEARSVARLPRQGKNQNRLGSMLRFGYYYADYLLGQWYVWLRYVSRGYVVLYDRYYYDFMADPRRSNLVLPNWIAYAAYRLLYTPHLNILLTAHPEVVLARKQELDLSTIQELNHRYNRVFTRLGKKNQTSYLPLQNEDLPRTLETISTTLQTRLGL